MAKMHEPKQQADKQRGRERSGGQPEISGRDIGKAKAGERGQRETLGHDVGKPKASRRRHPHPTLPHQGGGPSEPEREAEGTERDGPRWRRRKEDRPGDISAAALQIFAEKGFAGARIEEIARRAGLSKGALYLYFPTKEALFRAVVRDAVIPNIDALRREVATLDLPFAPLIRTLLSRFAQIMTAAPLGAVAKMVIGESRNFPELARVWHEDVVQKGIGLLSGLIERAQQRGEVRPGDPRIHALSLMGPMVLGVIWRETFTPIGAVAFDLPTIARQHTETVLAGLLTPEGKG